MSCVRIASWYVSAICDACPRTDSRVIILGFKSAKSPNRKYYYFVEEPTFRKKLQLQATPGLIYFFWYSPLFEMRQKRQNRWNCIVLKRNQIKGLIFQYKFKSIFPCNYLSHSTTNHFFSFHLCPIGNTLVYSVR